MQFGALTIDQWDHQLASSPPLSPTNTPPDLLSLASKTTPPPSPPKSTADTPVTSATLAAIATTATSAVTAITSPPPPPPPSSPSPSLLPTPPPPPAAALAAVSTTAATQNSTESNDSVPNQTSESIPTPNPQSDSASTLPSALAPVRISPPTDDHKTMKSTNASPPAIQSNPPRNITSSPNQPPVPPALKTTAPPRPLTWAARVAGVASSPHALPTPCPIPPLSSSSSPTHVSKSLTRDDNSLPSSSSTVSSSSLSSTSSSLTPSQPKPKTNSIPHAKLSPTPTPTPTNCTTTNSNKPNKQSNKPLSYSSSVMSSLPSNASSRTTTSTLPTQKGSTVVVSPPDSAVTHVSSSSPSCQLVQRPRRRRRRVDPSNISPRRLRGLINGGNCCFINVVLQALLACDAFRVLIHECIEAPIGSLVEKFVRLIRHVQPGFNSTVSPKAITENGSGSSSLPNANGKANSPTPLTSALQLLSVKEGTHVKEEPILADWFYNVFPSSSASSMGASMMNGHASSGSGKGSGSKMHSQNSTSGNGSVGHSGGSASGSQEDAEEFLTFILNALHEELVEWEGTDDDKDEVGSKQKDIAVPNGMNGSMVGHGHAEYGITTVDGRIHTMNGNATGDKTRSGFGGGSSSVEEEQENVWTEMTRSGKGVEIRGGEFAQSGVTDIFGGTLRNEVKRERGKTSVTREPFFSLSLDIESGLIRDVEHAVLGYFESEMLSEQIRKDVLLMQSPKTLILHLKRFSHNSVTGALNKVTRNMMFPEVLTVPGKIMHKAGSRWGCDSGTTYQLNAVVTHVGKELAGGHYTADVRWHDNKGQSRWFMCDDSKIVAISWAKVCRKQAYLLFYSAI